MSRRGLELKGSRWIEVDQSGFLFFYKSPLNGYMFSSLNLGAVLFFYWLLIKRLIFLEKKKKKNPPLSFYFDGFFFWVKNVVLISMSSVMLNIMYKTQ